MTTERLTAEKMLEKAVKEYYYKPGVKDGLWEYTENEVLAAMEAFARQEVGAATKVCNKLIEKQKEYIDAQDKQIKLVTGDLPTIDMEGFGYHALAISQNLTRIEQEMNELFEYWKQNISK